MKQPTYNHEGARRNFDRFIGHIVNQRRTLGEMKTGIHEIQDQTNFIRIQMHPQIGEEDAKKVRDWMVNILPSFKLVHFDGDTVPKLKLKERAEIAEVRIGNPVQLAIHGGKAGPFIFNIFYHGLRAKENIPKKEDGEKKETKPKAPGKPKGKKA